MTGRGSPVLAPDSQLTHYDEIDFTDHVCFSEEHPPHASCEFLPTLSLVIPPGSYFRE